MVNQGTIIEASRMILSSDWLGFIGAGLSEESGISTYRVILGGASGIDILKAPLAGLWAFLEDIRKHFTNCFPSY